MKKWEECDYQSAHLQDKGKKLPVLQTKAKQWCFLHLDSNSAEAIISITERLQKMNKFQFYLYYFLPVLCSEHELRYQTIHSSVGPKFMQIQLILQNE